MNDLQSLLICLLLYALALFLLPRNLVYFFFFFHVVFVPLIFKCSPAFRRKLVFANFVQWPWFIDFDKPSAYAIKGGRNLYIEHYSKADNCRIKIGLWHILPQSSYKKLDNLIHVSNLDKVMDEDLCHSTKPIIMYCHGNSNSRASPHRVRLYNRFQEMDFHVIAMDYRGYGDSTNVMLSEEGVVEDAFVTYHWILNKISNAEKRPRVFIWGHSLGTGIASHLLGNLDSLCEEFDCDLLPLPDGLILEAPFNNMADEVKHHPCSFLVKWLPYRIHTFVTPFKYHLTFCNDVFLSKIKNVPVLILHGKDDMVVPFILGLKLYDSIKSSRTEKDASVVLKAFETGSNLGHIWICNALDLDTTVLEFCDTQCNQTGITQIIE